MSETLRHEKIMSHVMGEIGVPVVAELDPNFAPLDSRKLNVGQHITVVQWQQPQNRPGVHEAQDVEKIGELKKFDATVWAEPGGHGSIIVQPDGVNGEVPPPRVVTEGATTVFYDEVDTEDRTFYSLRSAIFPVTTGNGNQQAANLPDLKH